MAARGQTITGISDIPATGNVDNVIKDRPGTTLFRRSSVQVFLTREGADVLSSVTVGGSNVMPLGPVNIDTVVGSIPSTQDDLIIEVIAQAGDEIIISGTNANAAAQELRALVKIFPI